MIQQENVFVRLVLEVQIVMLVCPITMVSPAKHAQIVGMELVLME